MRRARLLPLLALPLAACGGIQSMTGSDGRQGQIFTDLFSAFLIVMAIVFLVVMIALVLALARKGKREDGLPDVGESQEGRVKPVFYGWIGIISLILAGLALASFFADRDLAMAADRPRLEVQIIGHQWWWEVEYRTPQANAIVRTANELHLPVGVPVHVTLAADDVIHSLWIPNIAGKQDLIPGRVNDIVLTARHAGIYRGQCAEYCGTQHAHMALDVTAESPQAFAAWINQQMQPAHAPGNALQQAGYNYVMNRACGTCHAITGTPASGSVAPDLTHVATRRTIAAGLFPNTPGYLYAWIADPQGAKPGANMPTVGLEPNELHAIVAYLETLR